MTDQNAALSAVRENLEMTVNEARVLLEDDLEPEALVIIGDQLAGAARAVLIVQGRIRL